MPQWVVLQERCLQLLYVCNTSKEVNLSLFLAFISKYLNCVGQSYMCEMKQRT